MDAFPRAMTSKAVVSTGKLPIFVDPKQPPSKKSPYSAIMSQPFTHTVGLLLPEELFNAIWEDLNAKTSPLQYSRVIMPLSALLEGDFFSSYIKTGNIMMLSEGRAGVDDRYILKDGQLCLELAKERYERSGLVGKVIPDAGRKHVKSRYAVDIDLRQPSMLHGKKGFERVVWAFKNVLNESVTWLFYDFEMSAHGELEKPIAKHHPVTTHISPQLKRAKAVIIPELDPVALLAHDDEFEDWAIEIYEWLGFVAVGSPRILLGDLVDSFLCRYCVPQFRSDSDAREAFKTSNLVSVTWTGLLPAPWVRKLFLEITEGCIAAEIGATQCQAFFALNAHGFSLGQDRLKGSYTVLCLSDEKASKKRDLASIESTSSGVIDQEGMRFVLWQII